jgi:hypothetical protein
MVGEDRDPSDLGATHGSQKTRTNLLTNIGAS